MWIKCDFQKNSIKILPLRKTRCFGINNDFPLLSIYVRLLEEKYQITIDYIQGYTTYIGSGDLDERF